jgi:hypothetical protein
MKIHEATAAEAEAARSNGDSQWENQIKSTANRGEQREKRRTGEQRGE